MPIFSTLTRAVFSALDAETAHRLAIAGLKIRRNSGLSFSCVNDQYAKLRVNLAGLNFPNPLGIAAGFDKNGEVANVLMKLGFGYAEIGTVTPHAQNGNPRPRVFRLVNDQAVINRLGFNNKGHKEVLNNLCKHQSSGIVGVNIGANKDSNDFILDYELGIDTFWNIASYFTINISSPNTPGLRNLQAKKALGELLKRIADIGNKRAVKSPRKPPLFLKIAPDLCETKMDAISDCVLASDIDGLVIANTTIARDGLLSATCETGGLSGRPVFARSTIVLAKMRQRIGNTLPIIGVGGIDSPQSAWEKLEAGANLLQLYTGMIYQGPGLANNICRGLVNKLKVSDHTDITSITNTRTNEWAARTLPMNG